jgi:hypothetical protein
MHDFKLDPEAKRQWLEALRDPDSKQTQGKLNDGRGMCCLGVACDISGIGEWVARAYGSTMYEIATGHYREEKGLPDPVAKWLGLSTDPRHHPENPRIPGLVTKDLAAYSDSVGTITLAQLNDSGFTFAQIADVIDYFM